MGEILAPLLTEFDTGLSSEGAKIEEETELEYMKKKMQSFFVDVIPI